ncbi:hypothetical protein FOPE_01417 [Fonsecaea pedrosoi]|nr:hypothetical protein FOPE_01417 [Fonsecaea pedrosoi]
MEDHQDHEHGGPDTSAIQAELWDGMHRFVDLHQGDDEESSHHEIPELTRHLADLCEQLVTADPTRHMYAVLHKDLTAAQTGDSVGDHGLPVRHPLEQINDIIYFESNPDAHYLEMLRGVVDDHELDSMIENAPKHHHLLHGARHPDHDGDGDDDEEEEEGDGQGDDDQGWQDEGEGHNQYQYDHDNPEGDDYDRHGDGYEDHYDPHGGGHEDNYDQQDGDEDYDHNNHGGDEC